METFKTESKYTICLTTSVKAVVTTISAAIAIMAVNKIVKRIMS